MESDFDLDSLRIYVSDSILDFLTDPPLTTAPFPVDPLTSSTGTSSTHLSDMELDELFLACSTSYALEEQPETLKRPRLEETRGLTTNHSKAKLFAAPKTEQEIEQARQGRIPKKKKSDTKYFIGMWEWRLHKRVEYQENIPEIGEIPLAELAKLLSRFVLEVRKKNGDDVPPNSIHHIVSGLQRQWTS